VMTAAQGPVAVVDADADGLGDLLTHEGSNLALRLQAPAYAPPVASFSVAPTSPTCGVVATFDASASAASAGFAVVSYHWDYGDGATAIESGPLTTHAYPAAGPYLVQLTVVDDAAPMPGVGMTASNVVVQLPTNAPVADAGGPYQLIIGDDLTLDASASTDADLACGDSLTYEWDLNDDQIFGDVVGRTVFLDASACASNGFAVAGTHPVGLRVSDLSGSFDIEPIAIQSAATSSTSAFECGYQSCTLRLNELYEDPSPTDGRTSYEIYNAGRSTCSLSTVRLQTVTGTGTTATFSTFPATLGPCESLIVHSPSGLTSGSPVGVIVVVGLLPPIGTGAATVALTDDSGEVYDEVRISAEDGTHPGWTLGGAFHGLATRTTFATGSPWTVARIPQLDGDSGTDWTEEATSNLGRANTATGPRGADPRPLAAIRVNEVDAAPLDYVELFNAGATPVDLMSFRLRCNAAPGNGTAFVEVRPFPTSTPLAPGGYLVVGDGRTARRARGRCDIRRRLGERRRELAAESRPPVRARPLRRDRSLRRPLADDRRRRRHGREPAARRRLLVGLRRRRRTRSPLFGRRRVGTRIGGRHERGRRLARRLRSDDGRAELGLLRTGRLRVLFGAFGRPVELGRRRGRHLGDHRRGARRRRIRVWNAAQLDANGRGRPDPRTRYRFDLQLPALIWSPAALRRPRRAGDHAVRYRRSAVPARAALGLRLLRHGSFPLAARVHQRAAVRHLVEAKAPESRIEGARGPDPPALVFVGRRLEIPGGGSRGAKRRRPAP
jgi:PKD repeat protein